jgi:hypothetical protein
MAVDVEVVVAASTSIDDDGESKLWPWMGAKGPRG